MLPNGNTLIAQAYPAWVFEVTPAGQIVWEDRSEDIVFQARHTSRRLWADRESLSASSGGVVRFNMEGGTSRAGDIYVLLGSVSGTSPGFIYQGVTVPLNVDGYLTGLLGSIGSGIFSSWIGVLDAEGSGSASYALPALAGLSGLTMNHAFLAFDATSRQLSLVSNPVPLDLLP